MKNLDSVCTTTLMKNGHRSKHAIVVEFVISGN